jgi:thymidylate kinase
MERVPPEEEEKSSKDHLSLLYIFRSVLIAFDQHRLLAKAYRAAGAGALVLCDRYPSTSLGGMDGPRVDPLWFAAPLSFKGMLARIEQRLYSRIPRPDLIFYLHVPVEMAVQRNAVRFKKEGLEPEAFVRLRHALMEKWRIPDVPLCKLDTSQPFEQTFQTVKQALWQVI